VGGTQTSRVETAGDVDWFRVTLTAGVTYTIQENAASVSGSAGVDTFIRGVYTSAGKIIANTSNDDYGGSTDSQLSFTPPRRGRISSRPGPMERTRGDMNCGSRPRPPAI